jgi:alkylation response protein AidB-like acyl-CoA dehydrogenase
MAAQKAEEKHSLEVAEAARETEWSKPSFVAELFMGRLPLELILPFPDQSEEDKAAGDEILAKLRPFLEEKVDADAIDEQKEIPREVYQGLTEMGLMGIKLPQEYGGLGLSQVNYNRIIQLVSSHCASTAVMLSAHQSIGVPQPLKLFGTPEQKQKYLPRLTLGEVSAFALTEPGVGSDPSSMTTLATLADDGESYLINGEKLWISNGPVADLLIVMARTNDPQHQRPEITAFIVEGKSAGLSTAHRCDFMGLKGIQNGLLRFENVRVPKENIVVGLGQGLRLALMTLNTGRLTLPAACGGIMKQCIGIVRRWCNERVQWGAPVGHHEAVAAKIARMAADTFAVESLTWLTSALADRGDMDIRLEAAMAKLYCTEAMWRTVDETLQIRGGRGYETAQSLAGRGEQPIPVERMLRDARINRIIEGTSEIMQLFIAREALDQHLQIAGASATSSKMNFGRAARFYVTWYPRLWLPRFAVAGEPVLPGLLNRHLKFIESAARMLARDLFHMMLFYRQGLQRKQAILGRLVEIGAELFAMSAVISRAGSPKGPSGCEPIADLFCRQARRRIKALHKAVYKNDDQFAYGRARDLLAGNYPWLEADIFTHWQKSADK